ncbi:MAG: 2-oxoglutarate dehydrogenase complex dihydrolipoyllysine-residue succinyltransferase [Chromatiales bacterium]
MLVELKVPVLAESIADATLMEWRKQPGQAVLRGENLIDLETDKVTLEVPAPESGVLTEIRKHTGDTVVSNEVLAVIDTAAVAQPAGETVIHPTASEAAVKLSPAARKLVAEHALNPAEIPAGSREARLTKADIIDHLARAPARPVAEAIPADAVVSAPVAATTPAAAKAQTTAAPAGPRAEQRVPMTRLRKRAAERLLAAQQQAAILTTFNEVNMQPVMDLRERYRDTFEQVHGVRLGFMSLFAKAAAEALKKFPVVNASVDGDDILYHNYYDIGIAVSAPRGLVVPVIRDVDQLSLAGIEQQVRDLSEKARSNSLTVEELTGGTFTITNGGIFGSLLSTPIINPPQSAILGMHRIQERPVAEEGRVVIRPMMYLALSYDHRIIDGREAVQFLVQIKELLEDPSRILLQV